MPEVLLYGIGVIFIAQLAVMVSSYTTAPEGYEDKYGFHYGQPRVNASRRRRPVIRSRDDAMFRAWLHRRKIAA